MLTKMLMGLLLLCSVRCDAQTYKFLYYLDKDLNSTSQSKSVFTGKAYEYDGHLFLNCFNNKNGRLVLSAGVKDSSLGVLDGLYTSYYDNMIIESEGNYVDNQMQGVWKFWDQNGYLTDSVIYENNIRVAYGTYKYSLVKPSIKQLLRHPDSKDTIVSYTYSFTDSLLDTFTEKQVSIKKGKEILDFEVKFKGFHGLLKRYDSTGAVQTDSVFSRKLIRADFPGGEDAYRNYIRKELNATVPGEMHAPNGKYTILMKFVINPDGRLSDFQPETDPGYGMVAEVLRVLMRVPKFIPENLYGIPIKAYRIQPVTFLVEGN